MKTTIDEAINIGIKTYQAYEYAEKGAIAIFRFTCNLFKEHIRETNQPYSVETAIEWIKTHDNFNSKIRWERKRVVAMQKALTVLDDIIQNGQVTTSIQPKTERIPAYQKLSTWSKETLDQYLKILSAAYSEQTIRIIRENCSKFLLSLETSGIFEFSQITIDIIENTFEQYNYTSLRSKKVFRHNIENYIRFLINEDRLSSKFQCVLKEFRSDRVPLIQEQDKLSIFSNKEINTDVSTAEFYSAADKLLKIYEERHYSVKVRKSAKSILRNFNNYLIINSFTYSFEAANEWIRYIKTKVSHGTYNVYRRVILSINEIMITGDLKTCVFSNTKPKYPITAWQKEILEEYIIYRKREECAESTQRTIMASCSRFFTFLNHEKIDSLNKITPQLLKQYQLKTEHTSKRSKNLYLSQLRLFLRYLGEKELIPNTLELALSCQSAPNTKVVNILSEEQITAIYTYRKNAKIPIELRDSAIFLLGLRMGFRISDIVKLKFSDISWKEQAISITQTKTGVFLKLPMPIDVGNSIYKYIDEGRPVQANCEYIFVNTKLHIID